MAEMEAESRPVLVPGGNKERPINPVPLKPVSKPLNPPKNKAKYPTNPNPPKPQSVLKKKKDFSLNRNLSLDASCSSDASSESSTSRPSTGKSRRADVATHQKSVSGLNLSSKKDAGKIVKGEKGVKEMVSSTEECLVEGKRRCGWITPNAEPCYVAFHDDEWGVPVHDDSKLFELLVLSGALAELSWPVILSKRHIFREVFMDFEPLAVSKLSEKKILANSSVSKSLLSEPKLRAIIENSKLILKIQSEFGSFNQYIWNFTNHKPIISKFRYARQVPVKTSKAELISKDLVKRGFRSVGPTVIYTFMQVAGLTNDHLVSCFRFEICAKDEGKTVICAKEEGKTVICEEEGVRRGGELVSVE
ncbi:hypothetical protein LUZ60_008824 [Juncus effusus]|nr:hypothetical protein LUZ60_008824 [Juncus effusus]